jgi:hypothetical protein
MIMPFFVELAGDEYGNRGYTTNPPCVVEANVEKDEYDNDILVILAPEYIASKWSRIYKKVYGGWIECEGPARELGWDEREEIIARLTQ